MRNFTEVAKEVLEAEFPSSNLNRAFCIFNLAKSGTPRNTADVMPEEVAKAFKRLAQAFNIDMPLLVAQYNDLLTLSRHVKIMAKCSNREA